MRPHAKQSQLYRTRTRLVAVAAGRGSGKTELCKRRLVRALSEHVPACHGIGKPAKYFYHAPTLPQAKRIAWDDLKSLIPTSWLATSKPGRLAVDNTSLVIRTAFNSELHVCGMDRPQRIEGDQWCGGVGDESSDTTPSAYALSIRPALSHYEGWYRRIGVPKRGGIGAIAFRQCFEADSMWEQYTWPSSDILTPDEIRIARSQMDERDYQEQYEANWVTAGGACFYAFDLNVNVRRVTYNPNEDILVGSDFNVTPMAWVLFHLRKGCLEAFDEIYLRDTNTQRTLDTLHARYGATHKGGWRFIGDASSSARKTAASHSDYVQIKNDKRFKNATTEYPTSNPPVRDRIASCNALLCNSLGESRLFFDPCCRNTIMDVAMRGLDEFGMPQNGPNMGHASDAVGYVVHRLFPLRVSTTGASTMTLVHQ